jgi:hypothetical protein
MLMHGSGDSANDLPVRVLSYDKMAGIIEVVTNTTYPRCKIAYDAAGLIQFQGFNRNASCATTDMDWMITKFAYDVSSRLIDSQTLIMSWGSVTAGAWNI